MDERISAISKMVYNSLMACQTFSKNKELKYVMYSLGQAAANVNRLMSLTTSKILDDCNKYIEDAKDDYKKGFYLDGEVDVSRAVDSLKEFKRSFR